MTFSFYELIIVTNELLKYVEKMLIKHGEWKISKLTMFTMELKDANDSIWGLRACQMTQWLPLKRNATKPKFILHETIDDLKRFY